MNNFLPPQGYQCIRRIYSSSSLWGTVSNRRTMERKRGMITQQIWMALAASHPRPSYPTYVSGLSQSIPLSSLSESISEPQKKPQIATNKRNKANFGGWYDDSFVEITISPWCSPCGTLDLRWYQGFTCANLYVDVSGWVVNQMQVIIYGLNRLRCLWT